MAVLLALHASIQAQDYGITLYPPQGTGSYHNGPLVEAADGNFYGAGSNGSIFRLTVDGVATVIAQSPNGTGTSSLLLGSDGNLYGTTGANNTTEAAVYRATTSGQVTLVGSIPSAYNPDDESTVGPLVQDSAGNLYGVIADGGPLGNGLIFGMTPAGVFSVIHAFSITDPQTTFNTDGNRPNTGLVIDGNGNLYGLTSLGGANGFGTIYQATTTGGFSAAYHFAQYEGADNPNLPIAIDGKGTVYYSSGSSVATFAIRKFAGGALSALYTFSALNQTPGVSGEYNDDGGQPPAVPLVHPVVDSKGWLFYSWHRCPTAIRAPP